MVAEHVEIMFDGTFVGGSDLRGALPDCRGAMIAVSSVVNLSHPPAMPSLGKAAPDVVKKVENISLEDVMNLNWKGGSENVKKQAEKPKPVPVAVANRQPTLPGEKGFSKSAGRGRGVLAASNSTAPGKPLGAMEQIKLLEQKALAEQQQQQQQQQQQTKPPPPTKKKGIIGSLKDLLKKTPPPKPEEEADEKATTKPKKPAAPAVVSSLADIEAKLAQQTQPVVAASAPSSLAALEAKLTQQSISQAPPSSGGGSTSLQALEAKLLQSSAAPVPPTPPPQKSMPPPPKPQQEQKPKKTGWAPVESVQPVNVMSGKPSSKAPTPSQQQRPPPVVKDETPPPLPSKPVEATKAKPSFVPRSAARKIAAKPKEQLQKQKEQKEELHL
jgi:5'-3' exoribonuclease 1